MLVIVFFNTMFCLMFLLCILNVSFCQNITQDAVPSAVNTENSTQILDNSIPQALTDKSSTDDKDISYLKDVVKALNEQLQNFNSLYIGRLDQKLTSITSNLANIDSNVKNIQERAHVWDTFQLHVAAWNDQIKSLDRKVDIMNSGQEKMSILESKLSILLNLEYNSARIVNKLATLEDKLDQMERTLKRQQSDLSHMNQKDTNDIQSVKNVPNIIKSIERKTDRLIGIVQKINMPFGRRVARGSNQTQPQKLLIKCTTPPSVEETIKDVASKVDLIYDKIISDNISSDDCNDDDDKIPIDSSIEIEGEIEEEFPSFIFNSDEDDSDEGPQFKRQTRHSEVKQPKRNTTRLKRYIIMNQELHSEIDKIKSLLTENNHHVTNVNRELFQKVDYVSTNVETIRDLLLKNQTNVVSSLNIDMKINYLYALSTNVCNYVKHNPTSGKQSDIKNFCNNVESKNASTSIKECLCGSEKINLKNNTILKNTKIESNISNTNVSLESRNVSISSDFTLVCYKYLDSFKHKRVGDIKTPEELTCFIVHMQLKNNSFEYCESGNRRFCDENSFIIFQSRKSGVESFARSWREYKWGFGDFNSQNYWIGLEALHSLTQRVHPTILRVYLEDFEGSNVWAEYDGFNISTELNLYRILVNGYRGNATDGLSYHNGAGFSTLDVRNDEAPSCCPCSNTYGRSGWWFKSCFESNLNGIYFNTPRSPKDGGIAWESWSPNSTLSRSTMALGFLKSSMSEDLRL